MNKFLEEAKTMQDELTAFRRHIHANAEVGLDLPKTTAFVEEKLRSFGYDPVLIGGGIVCTCGKDGKVIMLRADMDALPQKEVSGLDFACLTGTACHSCGHDCHTAMLLGAAKLLKDHESELKGTVKSVFQPGEETLRGSRQMIDAGVLENPKVDVGMGLHMNFGNVGPYDTAVGTMLYADSMASADEFRITLKGRSAHGATPEKGISAISAGAAIVEAVQQLTALEISCWEPVVISFGEFKSGQAANIVPGDAVLTGSIRTFSREVRKTIKEKFKTTCIRTAESRRAECTVEFPNEIGPNINSPELTEEMVGYCDEVAERIIHMKPINGSEDFASYGEYIPTFFANIGAGGPKQGYMYSMHDPHATIDESALPYGTAILANCASKWLSSHAE